MYKVEDRSFKFEDESELQVPYSALLLRCPNLSQYLEKEQAHEKNEPLIYPLALKKILFSLMNNSDPTVNCETLEELLELVVISEKLNIRKDILSNYRVHESFSKIFYYSQADNRQATLHFLKWTYDHEEYRLAFPLVHKCLMYLRSIEQPTDNGSLKKLFNYFLKNQNQNKDLDLSADQKLFYQQILADKSFEALKNYFFQKFNEKSHPQQELNKWLQFMDSKFKDE